MSERWERVLFKFWKVLGNFMLKVNHIFLDECSLLSIHCHVVYRVVKECVAVRVDCGGAGHSETSVHTNQTTWGHIHDDEAS